MLRVSLCLLAVVALAAGQSTLVDLAMPDAKALLGVNLERLRTSRLTQNLWPQIFKQEPELAGLTQAMGLDPLHNLSEVLIVSPGGADRQSALLLARGSFAGLDLSSLAKERGGSMETFRGVEIVSAGEEKGRTALAVLERSLLIAGDPASVRGVIARREGAARPASELHQKAAQLGARFDLWGVSFLPIAELAAQAAEPQLAALLQGDVIKAVEQISGGVRLGSSPELMLSTVSLTEQDATNLANALRFFVGMAQARQAGGQPFLQDLKVSGRTLTLSLAIPEAEMERMVRALRPGVQAGGTSRPAAPPQSGVTSSPGDPGGVKIPEPKPPQ